MIHLLSSEWLRFRSRKLNRWLVILALIGIAVGVTIATATSKPPTDAQVAQARANYERVLRRCIRQDGFGDPQVEPGEVRAYCDREVRLDQFESTDQLAVQDLPEYLKGAAFIVILVGLVAGASAVGASWQSGTITTILTWEPRRIRWFLARLATVALGVFVIALGLMVVFALGLVAGAALHGSTTTGDGWFGAVLGTLLRIGGVAVGAALLGATVAMIGRNTAAALGAVFVYMAIFESVVRGFRPALGRFMLGDNIASLVGGTTLRIETSDAVFLLTPWRGAIAVAVYVIVLSVVAGVMLRARDVN